MVHEEIFNYFLQVAEDGQIPFDVAVPTHTARKAIDGLKAGKVKRFNRADARFKDLGL